MSKLGSALKAAGVTPDLYREPNITLDPCIIAGKAAKAIDKALGNRAVRNQTVNTLEHAALAAGFENVFVFGRIKAEEQDTPDSRSVIDLAINDLVRMIQVKGKYFAFAEPCTLTKRKTENSLGLLNNVQVFCAIWWDHDAKEVQFSLKVIVLASV